MMLKSRLRFAAGPGKLIYLCTLNPNHVSIVEDPGARQPVPTGD
jgi:hypothetical protein